MQIDLQQLRSGRLGTLVTGVTYRWPGILVKEVTTLEETLQIAQRMWQSDARPFVGRHYRLDMSNLMGHLSTDELTPVPRARNLGPSVAPRSAAA
jgi:hypothetical protein